MDADRFICVILSLALLIKFTEPPNSLSYLLPCLVIFYLSWPNLANQLYGQVTFVSVLFQHDAHAALSLVYCACDERMVINSASEGIE